MRLIRYRGKWAVEYYEAGVRRRVSTSTDDRMTAQAFLVHFAEDRRRPELRSVAGIWQAYRDHLAGRPSATTMDFEWLRLEPHFGSMPATAITVADCKAYTEKRRADGVKDGTIWTELGRLRSALNHAAKRGWIERAPYIERPSMGPPRDKRLTKAQFREFIRECVSPHVRTFAILAVTTGARDEALLTLQWSKVDFTANQIDFRLSPGSRRKGRAVVPMNARLREEMEAAWKRRTSDHVIEYGGRPVGSVKKALKRAGARSGFPWISPHVFRHSAATWMAEDGRPMSEIAQFLGHSDSRITERTYARFSPAYLAGAAKALEW